MPTDQVESLTHEVSRQSNVRRVLYSQPAHNADSVKDLIAQDHSEDESPFQKLLGAMSIVVYMLALGGLAMLIWSLMTE